MKALGMIEVYGYLAAVEALDSALKAANVKLVDVTRVQGGLVSVLITGDVGATKAAIDAAAVAAARVGTVVSVHVIPRPASDIERMLGGKEESPKPPVTPSKVSPRKPDPKPMPATEQPPAQSAEEVPEVPETRVTLEEAAEETFDPSMLTQEAMQGMTVAKLRAIARAVGVNSLSRKEIRYAKKEELMEEIQKRCGQEGT